MSARKTRAMRHGNLAIGKSNKCLIMNPLINHHSEVPLRIEPSRLDSHADSEE
jgi:hypothetical protein